MPLYLGATICGDEDRLRNGDKGSAISRHCQSKIHKMERQVGILITIQADDGASAREQMFALLGKVSVEVSVESRVGSVQVDTVEHAAAEENAAAAGELAEKVKRKRRTKEEMAAAVAAGTVEVDPTNTVSQPERIVEVVKEAAAPFVNEAPKADLSPENLARIANALSELIGMAETRALVNKFAPRVRELTTEQKLPFYELARSRIQFESYATPEQLACVGL